MFPNIVLLFGDHVTVQYTIQLFIIGFVTIRRVFQALLNLRKCSSGTFSAFCLSGVFLKTLVCNIYSQ